MFMSQGDPFWFFEKYFKKFYKKFLHSHSACSDHNCNLIIPYFSHDSRRFIINHKTLTTLSLN